ncbi:hypothetical protein ACFX5U_15380 [Sphingobacterium sp. SG20118]|uniref:hypothetical protein n=1 Tax=Sphingobacterium sp. SG20118 TaxID=3367156 RepID=UPI0037DFC5F5
MPTFQLNNPNNPGDPASYSLGTAPCSGSNQICTIEAPNSTGVPSISTALRNEMLQALNTRTSTTNVKLKT